MFIPLSQLFLTVCSLQNYHSSQKETLQTQIRTANSNLILISTSLRVRMFQKLQSFFQAGSPRIILVTISNERELSVRDTRDISTPPMTRRKRLLIGQPATDRGSQPGDCITRAEIFRTEASKSPVAGCTFFLLCSSSIDHRSSNWFYSSPDTFRRWKSSCDTTMYYHMIILILSDKLEINSFQHLFSIFSRNIRTILYDRHFSVDNFLSFHDSSKQLYTRVYTRIIVHYSCVFFRILINIFVRKNVLVYKTFIMLFQAYFNDDLFTNETITVEKRRGFCAGKHKNEGSETDASYTTYTVRLKLQWP